MATNLTTAFTDGTSSDATQSIFNTLLLVRGTYALIHPIVAKKYSLSRRSGKTMIWRRYEPLALATTPLSEGINPSGQVKTKTDVSATIQPYGNFIEDSDMVIDYQPDAHTTENVELLGQQMGETFDQLYRDLLDGATTTVFANGTTVATVTEVVDKNDLERAYRTLRVNKARPYSPMIMAGQKIGTGPVMPSYWGLADERVAFDLRHVDGFRLTSEYGSSTGILAGEIGSDANGIRFLVSPNGFFTIGASGTTAAGTDVKNTGGFVDVYSIFVCGMEAIGGINVANGNGGIIRHGLGTSGVYDALNMRATVGWKKYDARVILNQSFFLEVRTAVSL